MHFKYFAFKKYGRIPVAGPFKNRAEAKAYGKPGMCCRICGEYSGGSTICRTCILICLSGQMMPKIERKPKKAVIAELFCTA